MSRDALLSLVLTGDVMTGRGIDQIFPHPSSPELYESYVRSAERYVELAEMANGPIPRSVDPSYIWGDVLDEFAREPADLRIINLETSVTKSDAYEYKGINYRMNPENIGCLKAAGIDCCVLANNHVLDWGHEGLLDTIETLQVAGIKHAGAGADRKAAEKPGIMTVPDKARVLVFGFGHSSSGIPHAWRAGAANPGVNLLPDLSMESLDLAARRISLARRRGDFVIASIHWGPNWGYEVPEDHITFARGLIDYAEVDLVHGHSSHHPLGGEVYGGKLILYGCGDFLNDYEGIGGKERFRPELVLMYRVKTSIPEARLSSLEMVPFKTKNFRLCRVDHEEAAWLTAVLDREYRRFGSGVALGDGNHLHLQIPA